MISLGVDLSLTATGVVAYDFGGQLVFKGVLSPPTGKKTMLRGAARLAWLEDRLANVLDDLFPTVVLVEGYARGARSRREEAGEIGGIFRKLVWVRNIPYFVVSPHTLKKYVFGASSSKELIIREVWRKWEYEAEDNNDADAAVLAQMGLEWLRGNHTKKFQQVMAALEYTAPGACLPVKGCSAVLPCARVANVG